MLRYINKKASPVSSVKNTENNISYFVYGTWPGDTGEFEAIDKPLNNKKFAYDAERNNKTKGTLQYRKDEMPNHWFTMVKQLTMLGFFTSKQGASEALRYIAVPGKYEGDVPYVKGGRAIYPCY